MVCRKYGLIGTVRNYLRSRSVLRRIIIFALPAAAFIGHCIIQSAFVAPFTAAAALSALFLADYPCWAERSFLVLGKHSTNIWLIHMFFYLNLFPGFAFSANYPVLILALMLAVCFAASVVIEHLYQPILTLIERK